MNEKTGLYENYNLWHVPFWQTAKFKMVVQICAFLVTILVVAMLLKWYLAYRKKKKLSLWDQALFVLTQLKQENKVDVVHGKEFYATVSVMLKNYFHERFGYDVLGRTDSEFIEYLKKYYKDEVLVEEAKMLLDGATVIKFANAQAAQEQIEHDYLRAVAIIQRTIPEK
ncbi:MAG TPA: hypothetical protein VK431_05220 [Nitrosopumilaceae archaeon]|nr:hypothetical protein [Nitrosopumilaceae archaeon]